MIFIEFSDGNFRYGVVSIESLGLNPSLYRHLVGELTVSGKNPPLACVRNLTPKIVEIRGFRISIIISL